MKCPTCFNVALIISDRQGVEIDHCPECRGVWLDRGELDKLIDRASAPYVGERDRDRPQHRDSEYRGPSDREPQRRKSWLSDIFD